MAIDKFWTSHKPNVDVEDHIGRPGEIFYDSSTGDLRIYDGSGGGTRLIGAAAGNYIDDNYTTLIDNEGIVSVINLPTTGQLGPLESFLFDVTLPDNSTLPGSMAWNNDDDTINIHHTGGPVQQVGQETYAYVKNNTGSPINNGTSVHFTGASDADSRLEIEPYLADGATTSLYALGIATQTIANNGFGRVTVWGKVREIDTTGSGGETWSVGDVVYASPSVAGQLTNVKPTAPANVIPMGIILKVDASVGEMYVRPTITMRKSYGVFSKTADQTVQLADTAYTLSFDMTESSNGVTLAGSPATQLTVNQSGLYRLSGTAQISLDNGVATEAVMYIWLAKNGTDVANTMRRQGLSNITPGTSIAFSHTLSLTTGDYVELKYAGNSNQLRFEAAQATTFGPASSAVSMTVSQIQQ